MNAADEVVAAARRRARFLVERDADALLEILHPEFVWTTHTGTLLARTDYVGANTRGSLRWLAQTLHDLDVTVVETTAVLRCVVEDRVDRGAGEQLFRMPVTQTWVRDGRAWRCLAGHAGPPDDSLQVGHGSGQASAPRALVFTGLDVGAGSRLTRLGSGCD